MELERTISEKGQIVIPKDIRERLGLVQGSEVVFDVEGEVVTIRPKRTGREIVEEFCGMTKKRFKHLDAKKINRILSEQYEVP